MFMASGKLGAQLYTCRQFTKTLEGVAETFEKVAKIGYTAVQISGFGPVDPKQVGKLLADHGLTCAATHVKWDRFLGDLGAVIAEHKLWGCAHPAIGGLPGAYRTPEGIKRFLDELGPVAERLAAEGMDFSYHNHSHELAKHDGRTWLEVLYEQAKPHVLKAEIDTYWIQHGGGDPAAWIRRCAGREPLVHLKDMVIAPSSEGRPEQRMAEIGEGNLNWPAILEACEAGGVQWYLIEQDLCYDRTPFESLDISYRNLKAMGLS
jgi:sugar phosphate isomerase/epimerase